MANLGIPLDLWIFAGVVCVYVIIRAIAMGFQDGVIGGLMQVVLPAAIIVFAEPIGEFSGFVRGHYVSEMPPVFVKFIGWCLLLALMSFSIYELAK